MLLAAAALALALYALLPELLAAEPDYGVAIVSASPCPEETAAAVQALFQSLADDANGDGTVRVEVRVYTVDLSGSAGAGELGAAALDGDLMGKRSSLFLTDDPAGLAASVAVPVSDPVPCGELPALDPLSLPEGWYLAARTDSGGLSLYQSLLAYR